MFKLKLSHHFDASHKLKLNYDSPCLNNHGHRWEVTVQIWTEQLDENGMVVDFKKIKALINRYDHCCLNDVVKFNPTAEHLAKTLWDDIHQLGSFYKVIVEIAESPGAIIMFNSED